MKKLLFLLPTIFLLTGCPVPNPGETPVGKWYMNDPVSGAGFWAYVPQCYSSDIPSKVIVSCHGTNPWDVAEHHVRTWKYYGEKHNIIIVCPELIGTDGIFGNGPVGAMLICERKILSILSTLCYKYNIDQNNIMITGFSGGGFPTYFVGLRHPEIFSVVVAQNCNFNEYNLKGWYPPEARKIPLMIYYGQFDPQPIKDQSMHAISYFNKYNFDLTTAVLRNKGHDRMPQVALDFFLKHANEPKPTFGDRKKGSNLNPRNNNNAGNNRRPDGTGDDGGDIFQQPEGREPPRIDE